MSFIPSHKIYASNGSTLLYTVNYVIRRDPALSHEIPDYVELTNLRSKGSIVITGGSQPYDITLYAVLLGADYTALMTAWQALNTAIPTKTPLQLKIDKSISTTDAIKVMRLQPIIWDTTRGNLTRVLYYTLTLRANCWS